MMFFEEVDHFSCTTDIRSSVSRFHVKLDSSLEKYHLFCTQQQMIFDAECRTNVYLLYDSHTGENIVNLIVTSLQSWNIQKKRQYLQLCSRSPKC